MRLRAWALPQSGLVLHRLPLNLAIEVPSELVGEEVFVLYPPVRWKLYEELPALVDDLAECIFCPLRWSHLPFLFLMMNPETSCHLD